MSNIIILSQHDIKRVSGGNSREFYNIFLCVTLTAMVAVPVLKFIGDLKSGFMISRLESDINQKSSRLDISKDIQKFNRTLECVKKCIYGYDLGDRIKK